MGHLESITQKDIENDEKLLKSYNTNSNPFDYIGKRINQYDVISVCKEKRYNKKGYGQWLYNCHSFIDNYDCVIGRERLQILNKNIQYLNIKKN